MPTLVEEAKKQGYIVENVGRGFYKITNPATGKSTTAWEGVQYTGSGQLSGLGSSPVAGKTTSAGGSSSSKNSSAPSSTSSSSANPHYQWLEQTWPGGAQQYIQSQQQRYLEAIQRGDKDLAKALERDAERVGYTLPVVQTQTGTKPIDVDEIVAKIVRQVLAEQKDYIPPEVQRRLDLQDQLLQQILNQPKLTWEEAQARAQAALDPLYRQQMSETLKEVERNLIRRGFFGQPPSIPIIQDVAARIENARAAAIANLASQLAGQSEEAARWATQTALQAAQSQLGTILDALQASRQQQQQQFANLLAAANLVKALEEAAEEKKRWEKEFGLKEAAVTGTYQGLPTLPARLDALGVFQKFVDVFGFPGLGSWLSTILSYLGS